MDNSGSQLKKWWDGLTGRERVQVSRRVERRNERRQRRAALRSAPGASGYCCPKCHTWHPTPEARKACREEHRRAAEAAQQAVAA